MICHRRLLSLITCIPVLPLTLHGGSLSAQSITPANDGTGTLVMPNGDRLDIQGGSRSTDGRNLFHSFQRFGLSANETANFIADPLLQNILGRVTGGDPSVINGLIQITGGTPNLYLLNPTGILFGPNGRLDIPAAFTATTANQVGFGHLNWGLLDQSVNYGQLLGNPTTFQFDSHQPGSVVNLGQLTVGLGQSLNLLGGIVLNAGTLTAPGGTITAMAIPGTSLVRLSQAGSLLSLDIQPISPAASVSASPSLPQLLTGGGFTAHASSLQVTSDGALQLVGSGMAIPTTPGTTILQGTLSTASTQQPGGIIQVIGQQVGLFSAHLDASGVRGGTVLVGGDYRGQGTIPNALYTYIDPDTRIQADARSFPGGADNAITDAGRVIIWADRSTQFYGSITAKGADTLQATPSNGGFVEVSGLRSLNFQGLVETSAPFGQRGTLLLDPDTITIVSSGGNTLATQLFFADLPTDALLEASVINAATANVILQATNRIDFNSAIAIANPNVSLSAEAGDVINVNAAINVNSGGITLTANNQLNLNNSLTSGSGNVTLTATNGTVSLGSSINVTTGNVTVDGPVTLTTGGGNIATASGGINFSSRSSIDGNQPLRLNATGGVIQFNNRVGSTTPLASLTINTGSTLTSSTNLDVTVSGNISAGPVLNSQRQINLTSQFGNMTLGDLNAAVPFTGNAGSVSIALPGNLTVGNVLTGASGPIGNSGNITITAGGQINAPGSNFLAAAINGNGGSVSLTANRDIIVATLDTHSSTANAGDITLISNGSITTNGLVNAFTLTGTAGDVLMSANTGIRSLVQIRADSNPVFGSAGSGSSITLTTNTGNIATGTLQSRAVAVISGNTGSAGAVFLNAPAGNITVSNIEAQSFSANGTASNGGSVTLRANTINGRIVVTGSIQTLSQSDTSGAAANAGAINLLAGNITVQNLLAESLRQGLGLGVVGNGGAIVLNATTGSITTANIATTSSSSGGSGGNAGPILITAPNGSVNAASIKAISAASDGNAGCGGSVTLIANATSGIFTLTDQIQTFSQTTGIGNASNGGAITLSAGQINGANGAGSALSSYSFSGSGPGGSGGAIQINTAQNLSLGNISTFASGLGNSGGVTIQSGGFLNFGNGTIQALSDSGNSNTITLNATGNITLGRVALRNGQLDVTSNGNLALNQNLDLGTGTLLLRANGLINQTAGNITVAALGIQAQSQSPLTVSGLTTIAANITGASNPLILNQSGSITIGSVSNITGIQTNNGNIILNSTGGGIILNQSLNAGTGAVLLSTPATITQSLGTVTAGSLGIQAQAQPNLTTDGVTTIAANITGLGNPFSWNQTGDLTVGAVGSLTGIRTNNGSVALTVTSNLTVSQNITTGSTTPGIDGGNIVLISGGALNASGGNITANSQTGVAGNILLNAVGNLITNVVAASSSGAGNGGSVTLNTGGNLTANGLLQSFSNGGNAGAMNLTATGNLTTANLSSGSVLGQGGNVSLVSGGNLSSTAEVQSSSTFGTRSGNVTMTAVGNIVTTGIFTFTNGNGAGGSIRLNTSNGGINTVGGPLWSFSQGLAGSVELNAAGAILTGAIETFSGGGQNGASITLTSRDSDIRTNDALLTQSLGANGGNITLQANTGILGIANYRANAAANIGNIGNGGQILLTTSNGNIQIGSIFADSRTTLGSAGNGGTIVLNAPAGNIVASLLASTSIVTDGNAGNGGAITVTANGSGLIQLFEGALTTSQSAGGSTGNGGSITLSAGQINAPVSSIIQSAANRSGSGLGNSGNAGNITLTGIVGNVRIGEVSAFSLTNAGNAGNGGTIVLTANTSSGSIIANNRNIASFAQSGSNGSVGNGGDIILTAATVTLGIGNLSSYSFANGSNPTGDAGDILVATSNSLTLWNINAASSGSGNGGLVSLNSNGDIDLSAGTLDLRSGSGTTGSFNLNVSGNFTSGVILASGGNLNLAPGGNLTITQSINIGTGTLILATGGIINQSNGVLTAESLGILAQAQTPLNTSGVTLLAANITGLGNRFNLSQAGNITIGTVGNITGIQTNNGAILLNSTGNLTLQQSLNAGSADVLLATLGNLSQTGGNIIAGGLGVIASAQVNLNVSGVGTIAANITGPGNTFTFNQNGNLTVGSVAELTGITTSNGNISLNTTGNLSLSQSLNAGNANIVLLAGGNLSQSGGNILATGLGIQAQGQPTLNTSGITTIAVNITGPNNPFSFNQTGNLTIASVGSLSGIITNNGGITLNVSGNLTTSQPLQAGTGNLTLTAAAINQSAASWTAANTTLSSDTLTLSGTVTGTGNLTVQPQTLSRNIAIGTTSGGLDLSTVSLGNISGFTNWTIGNANGSGNLQLAVTNFTQPTLLRGLNTLTGANQTATWSLTSSNSGNIDGLGAAVSFINVVNLVGGSSNDTFQPANGVTWGGTLDGGSGTDTLSYSLFTTPVTVNLAAIGANNIEAIVGSSQNDTLIGRNINNNWILTSVAGGVVSGISFTSFEVIIGGNASDTFNLNGGSVTQINGGGGNDTLVGDNLNNLWTITDINSGTLNSLSFSNIANLTGGSQADQFTLTGGSITGVLDGGLGSNRLTVNNATNHWIFDATDGGILNGTTRFANVQNFVSGSGDDRLQFNNGSFSGSFAAGEGNVALFGDQIDFSGPLSGSGALTIVPLTSGRTLRLGGTVTDAAATTLTTAEVALLQNGFSEITIGSTAGDSAILFAGDVTFSDPVLFQASQSSIASSGGNLVGVDDTRFTFQAAQGIQVGNVTTVGGSISLINQGGTIQTGSLTSNGGVVTLTTPGNLTTSGINTSVINGSAGAVRMTSSGGVVTTDDILATGFTGGNVDIIALQSIRTGLINTSGLVNNGGNVFLDPIFDIEVTAINTQGGPSGIGGNVDVTVGRFFRASGTFTSLNGQAASISTIGGLDGGTIILRHGGRGFIPFIIGDATVNGTAGVITRGGNAISTIASGSFLYTYTQDSARIQIISVPEPPIGTPPISFPPAELQFNRLPPEGLPGDLERSIVDLDASLSTDYETHFDTGITRRVSFSEIRNVLREISREPGVNSAIIYAVFVPQVVTENPPNYGYLGSTALLRAREPRDDDRLELILVTAEGNPIRRSVNATRGQMLRLVAEFRNGITNVGSQAYRPIAQRLHQFLLAPLEEDLRLRNIENLVYVMDNGLRTIPLAALHNGESFIIERYSIGQAPSFSLTSQRYRDIRRAQVLAMGVAEFSQQTPLPAVPIELKLIVGDRPLLDLTQPGTRPLWPGRSFLNEKVTLANLKAQRQEFPYGIIHLATHSEFNPGDLQESYLQLWDVPLGLDKFREMGWNDPLVELLVLSACRTAVGSYEAELGFAGLAFQAGVRTTLGSLWYVSDEGTLGLMTAFYQALQATPIRSEALRRAQVAMLRGQVNIQQGQLSIPGRQFSIPADLGDRNANFAHPYYWSSFVMVGNPW